MIREDTHYYRLVDLVQHDDFHFDKGYLPTLRVLGNDIYVKMKDILTAPDGISKVQYVILNAKGKIMEDPGEFDQLMPHGFLARLTVPSRNPDPENIELTYLIDIDQILVETVSDIRASNPDEAQEHSYVTTIPLEVGIYEKEGKKIEIDDRLVHFNTPQNRQWFLKAFFLRK